MLTCSPEVRPNAILPAPSHNVGTVAANASAEIHGFFISLPFVADSTEELTYNFRLFCATAVLVFQHVRNVHTDVVSAQLRTRGHWLAPLCLLEDYQSRFGCDCFARRCYAKSI